MPPNYIYDILERAIAARGRYKPPFAPFFQFVLFKRIKSQSNFHYLKTKRATLKQDKRT